MRPLTSSQKETVDLVLQLPTNAGSSGYDLRATAGQGFHLLSKRSSTAQYLAGECIALLRRKHKPYSMLPWTGELVPTQTLGGTKRPPQTLWLLAHLV